MTIQRVQYALKETEKYEERRVIHFETDSSVVIMNDGRTLDEFAQSVDGTRRFTITGAVTGQAEINGHDDVIIEVNVEDDSHRHSGGTVFVKDPHRVLVSLDDGSIDSSVVTDLELSRLTGIRGNVQELLDNKIKKSEINGNAIVDGQEMVIYKHPEVIPENIDIPGPEDERQLAYAYTEFGTVQHMEVDETGHVTNIQVGNFKMPRFAQFYNTSIEPTDQVAGDFWLETLSVTVAPGNHFTEDVDGDLGQTETVNENAAVKYIMTDVDTGKVEPAAPMEVFQFLADIDEELANNEMEDIP